MIRDQIANNEKVMPNSKEVEALKELLPQYFDKDGQFIQDRFIEMLKSNEIVLSKEGYELKFLGKSYARYLSSTSTETFIAPLESDNDKIENKDSENIYIIGDNLDALKHLLGSYAGEIKCIYIDPPYNTGTDKFVYPDDFKFDAKELADSIGIEEEEANRILNLAGKSSHSAWLTFMYPRLKLASLLLDKEGVIFISIDDNEQANLKNVCDEIFGEENFIDTLHWKRKKQPSFLKKHTAKVMEYVLVYAKNAKLLEKLSIETLSDDTKKVINISNTECKRHFNSGVRVKIGNDGVIPKGKYKIRTMDVEYLQDVEYHDGRTVGELDVISRFSVSQEKINQYIKDDLLFITTNKGLRRDVTNEEKLDRKAITDLLLNEYGDNQESDSEFKELFNDEKYFDYTKPTKLICNLIKSVFSQESIILDFFSGTATTAHAVLKLNAEDDGNRKFIMVQLPEQIKDDKLAYKKGYRTIDQIGRDRIKAAAKMIKNETDANIDYGFKTFKLEPINQETLNRMIDFNPAAQLLTEDMISVFNTDVSSGKKSILTTWLNEDGYGLTAKPRIYALDSYKADLYQNSLYIIEEGLLSSDVIELVKRLENLELDINRIVVYPYSIEFSVMQELKKNINNLRNNKSVEVIERY